MDLKISIEYCVEWNYYPQASRLAAIIEDKYGIKVELIKSGGGVFEVRKDDELIFSKKRTNRFPVSMEIFEKLG